MEPQSSHSSSQQSGPMDNFEPPKVELQDAGRKAKKGKKKLLLLAGIIIVALVLAGAAAWWVLLKDKADTANSNGTPGNSSKNNAMILPQTTPQAIAYAFRATDDEPYVLYTRPAAGGDRTEVKTLGDTEFVYFQHVRGLTIALVTTEGILVSTNGGKTYTSIYTPELGSQITSLQLNEDGSELIFAEMQSDHSSNVVSTIGLDGSDKQEAFTSEKTGVFLKGWHKVNNEVIYNEGCYSCDGPPGKLKLYDLSAKQSKELLQKEGFEVDEIAVSTDLQQIVYVLNTHDASIAIDGLPGEYYGPPYTVHHLNRSKNTDDVVATIGTKGEKAANGEYNYRRVQVGFASSDNGELPYYGADKKVYAIKNGKAESVYETSLELREVLYVNDSTVITSIGPDDDWTLNTFDIATKQLTKILSGDGNTYLYGVTTE